MKKSLDRIALELACEDFVYAIGPLCNHCPIKGNCYPEKTTCKQRLEKYFLKQAKAKEKDNFVAKKGRE